MKTLKLSFYQLILQACINCLIRILLLLKKSNIESNNFNIVLTSIMQNLLSAIYTK